MNKTLKNVLRFTLLVLLGLMVLDLACMMAIAQEVTNTPPVPVPDGPTLDIFKQLKPLEFLLIPAVTVLIQAARKFIPQIPDALWPWVAPFVGALLDYLASKAGLWTGNVAIGMMLGGLGTWFHQLDKNSVNVLAKLLPPAPKT